MVDPNFWQSPQFPFGQPMPPSKSNVPMPPPFFLQQTPPNFTNQPSFWDQFRKPDGTWDVEKIINHGGQIMSIVNQARPLVKQMAPLMSLFKK